MESVQLVLEAAHYAAEKYANQKRKSAAGEPYVNHLIEVAQLVSMAISDPDIFEFVGLAPATQRSPGGFDQA